MKFGIKTLAALAITGLVASQANASMIFTGIIDGSGSSPKGVEVYVTADGDYSDWEVRIHSNGNTTTSGTFFVGTETGSLNGVLTEGFYYITSTATDMINQFASATSSNTFTDGSFNMNGDDALGIYDASSTLIDELGEIGVDGSGEAWEYTNSYGYRVDQTGPDSTFNINNWDFPGDDHIDDNGGDDTLFPAGSYTPIPEPASMALLGLGGALMLVRRRH